MTKSGVGFWRLIIKLCELGISAIFAYEAYTNLGVVWGTVVTLVICWSWAQAMRMEEGGVPDDGDRRE